jgi:hypothetical protein
MSLSQAIFFLKTAAEDLRGKKPTYSDIRGSLGERIQRTLHTTYRVVCERSRVYPKATGWLKRTTNKADNREKFLSVTPEGRAMLLKIREHLADKF